MSEMIERIAKVLAEEDDRVPMPTHQEVAARIIAAMREPTVDMATAAKNAVEVAYVEARAVWRTMIDEALK